MRRFVYAPDVEAYVQTNKGVLDLSEDIITGSVTLRINGSSEFSITLQNPHRKYLDTSLSPMDPIIIYLTRVKRMLVFSGYVDTAPIDQIYPEPVTITGSDTLKRLKYTYWNPQLPYVEQFLSKLGWVLDPQTGNILDMTGKSVYNMDAQGSLGNMLQHILHNVGGWDIGVDKKGHRKNSKKNSVQIMKLPKEFITVTQKILTAQRAGQEEYEAKVVNYLNNLLTVNGITTDPYGTGSATQDQTDPVMDTNPLPVKFKGKYKAFTYGPKTNLSGFAENFQKRSRQHGEGVTAQQAQNASIIVDRMTHNGLTAKAAAAFVAIAWKAESGLIADRVEDGKTKGVRLNVGYGLFQLTETTSTNEWISPGGYVPKAVKKLSGKTVTVHPGDEYMLNATYNSEARAMSLSDNDIHYLNNSSDPLALVSRIQVHSSVSAWTGVDAPNGPDYNNSTKNAFEIVWGALQANKDTSTNNDTNDSGSIGDVKVGNPDLIDRSMSRGHAGDPSGNTITPYTFRIKPNPYGNDTNIFAAVKYDPKLKRDEISIWAPADSNLVTAYEKGKEVSIETSLPGKPFPPASGSSDNQDVAAGQAAVKEAKKFLGTPYVYGGKSPSGFDCSGLTQYVYNKLGISIGGDTTAQWAHGPVVPKGDALEAGDLIFFSGTGKPSDLAGTHGHVAIVVDPAKKLMIDAPHTGANVRIERYSMGQWGSDYYVGATRPAGTDKFVKVTSPKASGTGVSFTSQSFSQSVAAMGMGLPLVFPMAQSAQEAQLFTGDRAYQDAQPLINLVDFICKASGRNFKSTPRGDFFAFYPDYFNWTKTAPYWKITDIETQDLTINFTDQPLATHVFTTADTYAAGSINISEQLFSSIASVESLGSFPDLVNTRKDFNYRAFLEKFGARPLNEEVVEIKNSFMQFMYGWMTFLEQWAKLFQANPTFTFMPELIPGGLVKFGARDLTMYVNEVTHNFDRGSGFTTTANLISPSSKKGHYALMVIEGAIDDVTPSRGGKK